MRRMAIANQKGGCGKTTTAVNLSWNLFKMRRNVLLVDMDPQAHGTIGLGVYPGGEDVTLADVLLDEQEWTTLYSILYKLEDGLELGPATLRLAAFEPRMLGKRGRERRLFNALNRLNKPFDYIIVDCPPNLGLLTFNSLFACDEIIVPVEPSMFSYDGLNRLVETVSLVEEVAGYEKDMRILRTMLDSRTRFARLLSDRLEEKFGNRVFSSTIPRSIKFAEAAELGLPIQEHASSTAGAIGYWSLAEEILAMEPIAADKRRKIKESLESQKSIGEKVLFSLRAPDAEKVSLVGDFNNWSPEGADMLRDEHGVWRTTRRMPRGTYQYRFVVDGEWMSDPTNELSAENAFGEKNSLIHVD